jgi:hypothetical protein
MHERVNKSSSWTPTSSQKKSKSLYAKPSTSIQPKQENISSQQQEMPTYSTAAADLLAANIMRSLEPKEPESSETSTGKLQSETGQAAFPLIAAPIPSTPVVQSQEIGIQRQCSECAKEQSTEEGKDINEISLAASGIQTKLTIGAPPNPYQQAANQMAEVMSKPILYAPMPQVQRFSPEESQIQLRAASAQSISPMMQMSVEQQAQMSALIQRTFRGEGTQASFEPVQAKLTAGEPGDKYEQEADAVAHQVVEQINAPKTEPSVQRQSEVGGASERNITVMRHSESGVSGGESVTIDVEQGIHQARGGGQGLDDSVREPMERAFGADFSGVKVHADGDADRLNRSIAARAFTTGQDIFFKQGEYDPRSRGGQELLAHELTHVVQQTGRVQLQPQEGENQVTEEVKQKALHLNGLAMFDILTTINKNNKDNPQQLDVLKKAADEIMKGWPPRVQFAIEVVKNRKLPEGMQGLIPHDDPIYADKWLKQSGQPMGKSGVPVGTNGMFKSDTPTPALKRWDYVVYQDHVRLGNRKVDDTPNSPVIGSWPWMTNNPGDLTGDLNPRKEKPNDPASYYWQDQRIWGKPRGRGESIDKLKPIEDSSKALSSGNTAVEGFAARKDLAIFADRERGRRALKEWIQENYGNLTLAESVKKHLGPTSSHLAGVDDPEKYPTLLQQYLSDKNYQPDYVRSTYGKDVKQQEWNDVIDAFGFAEGFYNRRPDPDAKGKFRYYENKGIIYHCDKREPIDVDPGYQNLKRVTDMPETTPPEIKKLLGCD